MTSESGRRTTPQPRRPVAIRGVLVWGRATLWVGLVAGSAALLALDFATGPYITFPITFVLPVALAAWSLGIWPAAGFAVGLVVCQFALRLLDTEPGFSLLREAVNECIRLGVLLLLAVLVRRVVQQHRQLALRVTLLEGVLPICAHCKKIRRGDGEWEHLETYISDRSPAKFSHGLCGDCAETHYPEVFRPPGPPAV